MTPEVAAAIEEIVRAFPAHPIDATPEHQGGAHVFVQNLDIGPAFQPSITWCGFLLGFQYPSADVYPHYIDGSIVRADGAALPTGITGPTTWQDRKVLQVSRKSPRWHPAHDTAALKLAKVLDWLRSL